MLSSLTSNNVPMLFCINKYFRRSSHSQQQKSREEDVKMVSKLPTGVKEPLLFGGGSTTTAATRSDFFHTATAAIYPNTRFTDHESIPSLSAAFATFTSAFPSYTQFYLPDHIRNAEYYNLTTHIPFDYTGFGLFSHAQTQSGEASSSSSPPRFFDICYKPAIMNSDNQENALEIAIKKRIMDFLTISDEDYTMVCTANTTTAFKLLAESYPFHSNKRLLTVYDHKSESVGTMMDTAAKRGAKVRSASFSWPSLSINGAKLRKMVSRRKKKDTGLFVFPLESRVSGARYRYTWMRIAQENGWHVVLDASALGPKGMDSLGLSLYRPEFIVCSFYKVFGGNPSGFAGLFINRANKVLLEASSIVKSFGVVSIAPLSRLTKDFSSTDSETTEQNLTLSLEEDYTDISSQKPKMEEHNGNADASTSAQPKMKNGTIRKTIYDSQSINSQTMDVECRGLDHADSMGVLLIRSRLRCITNWLVIALMKLRHPGRDEGHSLVKIYGPRVKFDRAPALSFNVFDWNGDKVEPALVQKLADRSHISLSCGFLHNILFPEKYKEQRDAELDRRDSERAICCRRNESMDEEISVVSASLGFLASFEDVYRLWAFVAKFLDADFVEKERWRYMTLNHNVMEV